MNLDFGSFSYSRSNRPIISCTDHRVAICNSLQASPCFLCRKSVVYKFHSFSSCTGFTAVSRPSTRSSQYSKRVARTFPALPEPTDVNSKVWNRLSVFRSILKSLAFVFTLGLLGNTSLYKYSPSGSTILFISS